MVIVFPDQKGPFLSPARFLPAAGGALEPGLYMGRAGGFEGVRSNRHFALRTLYVA